MKDLIILFIYSIFIEVILEVVRKYIEKKEIYLSKVKKILLNIGTVILTAILFLGIIYLMEYLDPSLLDLVEL